MFEEVTFESILDRMLSRIPDTMDKREGSVIYDALAPAAIELQLMYIQLDTILQEAFADTQSREYLVKRAAERGLYPYASTHAVIRGTFTPPNIEIPIGSRFNIGELNYTVTEKITDGSYKLICESFGTQSNQTGIMIPIEEIEGLETATAAEILIPGEDEEDTELFRQRYFDSFDAQAFGGNVADYTEKTKALNGVGGCKVYPVWNGAGTVKVVIIDSTYHAPSTELIRSVQTALDPEVNQGKGYGLAPIGHVVTVEGAEETTIDIQTTIVYNDGYDLDSAINSLRSAIDGYFSGLCENWESGIVVRISNIEYYLLECAEVLDVSDTKLNGEASNLILDTDQIPKRGIINGV